MKKAVKKRWVNALRSGEYKQATGVLHDGKGFCCLGVLCDIELDDDWVLFEPGWGLENEGFRGVPLEKRRLAWGLSYVSALRLAQMNDRGTPFSEIADWIEEKL